jgi:hypothetical protein
MEEGLRACYNKVILRISSKNTNEYKIEENNYLIRMIIDRKLYS